MRDYAIALRAQLADGVKSVGISLQYDYFKIAIHDQTMESPSMVEALALGHRLSGRHALTWKAGASPRTVIYLSVARKAMRSARSCAFST